MKTSTAVLSLVLCCCQTAFSQISKNMVLAGIVPANTMYGRTLDFTKEQTIADVWGWTYQSREYSLVCLPSNRVLNGWDGTTSLSGSGFIILSLNR